MFTFPVTPNVFNRVAAPVTDMVPVLDIPARVVAPLTDIVPVLDNPARVVAPEAARVVTDVPARVVVPRTVKLFDRVVAPRTDMVPVFEKLVPLSTSRPSLLTLILLVKGPPLLFWKFKLLPAVDNFQEASVTSYNVNDVDPVVFPK